MTPELLEAAAAVAMLAVRLRRLRTIRRDAGDDQGDDHAAEDNTYDLPDGEPIADELRDWLAKQKAAVLAAIPDETLPAAFPDLTADQWTDPMAKRMTPLLASYWDEAGKEVFGRLGLDPDDWRVTNPHLEAQIAKQAMSFCQSTNDTTAKRLDHALDQLRQQLTIGMVEEGESVRDLTKRVQYVFETMSDSKAAQIAATEASRAVHAAELTADLESEVVAGLELLISSDACPLCRKIATECKRVRLGESFAVIGSNPAYKDIRHPPLHPHCQCTIIEVLKPEYGGPVAPEWGHALQQPQKGLKGEYTPPAGKVEPKPEPDRPKPRPTKPPPKAKVKPAEPAPVPKSAIDQAVEFATSKGVKIEAAGADRIKKTYGEVKAQDVPAAYYPGSRTVVLNNRHEYWQDPKKWMDSRTAGTPPWFSSSAADHAIVHEIGHARHHEALGDARFIELQNSKLTAAEKRLAAAHVSGYGATKPVEFVAEMYAGLSAGKAYNEDVTKLYERFGGPRP